MDNENIEEIDISSEKQSQEGNPNWKKGMKSPNPDGKPKGLKSYITLLEEALKDVESVKGKQLFKRFIERAFVTDKVLIAAMKKFVPDMEKTEITTPDPVVIKIIYDDEGS